MIDFGKILKRAWHILWNYRTLWIFGFLLALFGGMYSGSNAGSGNNGVRYNYNYNFNGTNQGPNIPANWPPYIHQDVQQIYQWFQHNIVPLVEQPAQHIGTFVLIGLGFFFLILIISVIVAFIRYPVFTAILRMVDGYEATGEKVGFGAGWKLGWNKRAFRVWWVDFLIQGIPGLIIAVLILGTVANLIFQALRNNTVAIVVGAILLGLAVLLTLVIALGVVFLRLLGQFFWRKVALEDKSTKAAFSEGWAMFKQNWKSALLMWLIMVGIKIGFGIAMFLATFLLIPAFIVLVIPAAIVAIIPGLVVFGIASLFGNVIIAAVLGIFAALPFFILIVAAPLTFLFGMYLVYDTSAWTLAYREMKAFSVVAPSAPATLPPITA
jgi:hypothetical protein